MTSAIWGKQQTTLQQIVRNLRTEAGLTQQELSLSLGKPQSYVSKYESGERRLDIIEIREVCSKCGISLQDFAIRLEKELARESHT